MRIRALSALVAGLLLATPSPQAVDARPGGALGPLRTETPVADAYVRLERVIDAADLGLRIPRGITFARESGALLITGTRADGTAGLQTVSLLDEIQASAALAPGVPPAADVAYDSARGRLIAPGKADSLTAVSAAGGRVQPGVAATESSIVGGALTGAPRGIAVNGVGEALVLDQTGRVVAIRPVSPTSGRVTHQLSLSAPGDSLTGLAVAASGHLFSIGALTRKLYEFDATGELLAGRDLASLGVASPQDIAIAPSADTSDAVATQNVYVTDAGGPAGIGASVVELALIEPPLSPQVAVAASGSVSLVNTINTGAGSAWNPDSPDPSGLAYIPASETDVPADRRGRLVASDGEVEEVTGAGFHNTNVWFAPRDGSQQTATFDTTKAPTNPVDKEPAGAAYDAARNELYIGKDGSGGRIWVYDASATPMTQVRTFSVTGAPYNNADNEGLAFASGVLYMVDAIDNDLVKVQPGGNGIVGTGGDDVVTNYDLQQFGQFEPEGLDVHPGTGNIWIVSNHLSNGRPDPMIEVTPNGALVSTVSIAAANPNSAAGLAIAPPSSGSPGYDIYVSDRGVDNNPVPSENDGKIYEFSLGSGSSAATDTTITSGPQGDVTATDATFTFTGTASAASFECNLDAAGFAACSSPQSYPGPLALGSHTFEVRALDASSNPDLTPASQTWNIVASPPPDTTITSGPQGDVTATDATFTFTGTASAASFECNLDAAGFAACSSPQSYPGPLALGSHTFEVRALDASSNPDLTPASQTWNIVASPPPDTTITSGPQGDVTATDATFTFTGTASAASFECNLDAAGFAACSSPQSYPGPLALGSHTFEVRALDASSNPDLTPASQTWNIVASPENLLANPSFELDGDGNSIPDSWGTHTKFTRSAAIAPQAGSFVGRHFATNDVSYTAYQEVPGTGNTLYTLSAWVNVPTTSDAFTMNLKIRWMAGSTILNTTTIGSVNSATPGWVRFVGARTAPVGTTAVRVMMVMGSLNATVYVDDFSLTSP